MKKQLVLSAALLPLISQPFLLEAAAEETQVSMSVGYDYSRGEYGTDDVTTMKFIPISAQFEMENWTLKVTTSWLEIDGPASLIGDGEVVAGEDRRERGMGDSTASLSYLVYPFFEHAPFFELTGKVKNPTGDKDKGLGTGETDYTGMISMFKQYGRVTVFSDAGYRWRGKSDDFDLEDGYLGSVGASYKHTSQLSGGLIYSFRESASGNPDHPQDLMPYFTYKAKDDVTVTVYGTFGLTDASPDAGAGITVKRKFR